MQLFREVCAMLLIKHYTFCPNVQIDAVVIRLS